MNQRRIARWSSIHLYLKHDFACCNNFYIHKHIEGVWELGAEKCVDLRERERGGRERGTGQCVTLHNERHPHTSFSFPHSNSASWYYQSFIYPRTDALVSCFKKTILRFTLKQLF